MAAKKQNEAEPQKEEQVPEKGAPQGQDPQAAPGETAVQEEKPAELELSETDALKAQIDELNDRMMRTLAEYDNYRKRSQRERLEIYPDAVASTVEKFLPVLDNFERAMESECTDAEFKKGLEMILTSFHECLKGLNVEEIEALGKEFDPNLHNAVMHVEDGNLEENTVAAVFQKGYRMGDKVLRHAMVQVAN